MKLKSQSLVALGLSLFAFIAILYSFSQHFITQSFLDVERVEFKQSRDRYENGFQSQLDFLDSKMSDWASWDDTYDFMKTRSNEYLKSNYDPLPFYGLKINIAAIIDLKKKILFAKEYGPSDREQKELGQNFRSKILAGSKIIDSAIEGEGQKGILKVGEEFFLYSARPILPTSAKGKPRGVLFFARRLNDKLIEEINQSVRMSGAFYPVESPTTEVDEGIRLISDKNAELEIYLTDEAGERIGKLAVTLSRPIFQKAEETMGWIKLLFALTSVFIVILITLLLNFRILSRIQNLKAFIQDVEHNQNFEARLNVKSVDELDDLAVAFNEMLERFCKAQNQLAQTSKMSALGEMAAGIAHEINNPLAIISGSTQLLQNQLAKNSIQNEKINSLIQKIDGTTERVAKIVKALRNFARDGSHDAPEFILPRPVIEDALSFCRERIRNSATEWTENIAESEISLYVRPVEISQVIVNLLNNALDHIRHREDRWIHLRAEQVEESYRITVSNSGPPIKQELQSRIFMPFYTTKHPGEGTGLGLSISKGLTERNGGKLYYDSHAPYPKFVLELPIAHQKKKMA